jgi:orotidine-5'-phosphate decarboxylase
VSKFLDKLTAAAKGQACCLCVGLDPDPGKFPAHLKEKGAGAISEFNRAVIDATKDLAAVYKPNLAFYEAHGETGLRALSETLAHIPSEIVTIGDAKRGDIGNSAKQYARALFDGLGFDAVTVNPYMGTDCVLPFLEYADRGVIVLVLTSNPGSADFQRHHHLFLRVVEMAAEWNKSGNVGIVVGAQHPEELAKIRLLAGDMPILVPGVGAQGGDLAAVIEAGKGKEPGRLLVNVSRGILYASSGVDFADASRKAAEDLVGRMKDGD